MHGEPTDLSAVESFIATRRRKLAFPAWLEGQYERDTRSRRAQRLRASIPTTVVLYNLFLIADWFLVPDQFALALLLHAAVVTPWILCVGWLVRDTTSRAVRESAAGTIPVVIVIQILVGFMLTSSPDADHYQYFVLLVLLFATTVQRLPFHYALVVSVTIVVCHAGAVFGASKLSPQVAVVASLTLTVAAYLTLVSNYFLERDARRTYLHVLRDRLRNAALETASRHDALTMLANRRHLTERLAELWNAGDDAVSPVAMIMLDIDHFKLFNDRYGHVAGDACIKRVAACVRDALRASDDTAVRYGGEELLVLLPKTDVLDAVRIAERIRRSVEVLGIPHEGFGARRVVTVSCGAAAAHVTTIAPLELIAATDVALYAAKRNGRNQVWPPLLRASTAPERRSDAIAG